jgi:hypothetical protein
VISKIFATVKLAFFLQGGAIICYKMVRFKVHECFHAKETNVKLQSFSIVNPSSKRNNLWIFKVG